MRQPSDHHVKMTSVSMNNAGVQHNDDDRLQRQKRRRRRHSPRGLSVSTVVLWVTLLSTSSPWNGSCSFWSSLISAGPIVVVQAAHQEEEVPVAGSTTTTTTTHTSEQKAADDATTNGMGVDAETEAIMNSFLQTLRHSTYLDLIVQASQEKKSASQNRGGPPVMIGRRRSLLEHSLHTHYSMRYLQQLKRRRGLTSTSENDQEQQKQQQQQQQEQNEKREAQLHAALKAFLYLTPLDAHVKANPQRQQHNAATSNMVALPPFPPSARRANAQLLKDMFYRSYNAYMEHSFPAAELLPLTCQPGTFDLVRLPALTLIDALDTLIVLGDSLEFAKSVERLRAFHEAHLKEDGSGGIFGVNQNVSVFETTIRVLGGLLSAHQMAVAYLKNQQQQQQSSTGGKDSAEAKQALPPVFLRDVFDSTSSDVYLQPPEHVQRILEQHAEKYPGDGTCTVANAASDAAAAQGGNPDDLQIPDAETNHHPEVVEMDSNHEDWRDHCGAGVLSLEDCAAAKSPPKTKQQHQQAVNQTVARLKKEQQLRLLREPQWEYDGFLLELALDIGKRLLPAFDTRTGIPYGTVNLVSGVPSGETTVASLAGGGTLSLEMELLSRLTGDLRFGRAAKLAIRALWLRRSNLNLVGKHIDIQRGTWTENLSGIGSNSDSFLEYLLKHYLLFPEEEDFWTMLQAAYTGIFKDARLGEWYADVDMKTGKQAWPKGMIKRVLESLMAFYPGMQTLMGELVPAGRSLNSFFMVREFLGFLPERFSYSNWKVDGGISSGAAKYPLRPELLESCYFMHRATKTDSGSAPEESSSSWQWAADFALHHLERLTRAKCGYASVRGLSPTTGSLQHYQQSEQVKLFNEMPSFFLSETIKYLYLTFDDNNIIHNDKDREWIFTTEAHPIHYVPTPEQQVDEEKSDDSDSTHLLEVKERLRKKLKVLKYHKAHRTFSSSRSKPPTDNIVSAFYLAEELWSDNTQPRKYRNSIKEVVDEIYTAEEQNTYDPEWHAVKSFFGEEVTMVDPMQLESKEHLYLEENNLAHMTWSSTGLGSGYGMRKACPNVHAPELTLLHALNGGALDYTDIYVSAMSESDGDYPQAESVHLLVSSAEALSVHGSGVYLGMMDSSVPAADQCPLTPQASSSSARTTDSSSSESGSPQPNSESSDDPGERDPPDGAVQQVELAGMGTFEIKAFPEGSGFIMKHIDSGESIMTTFIAESFDGFSAEAVTLMVYATMPRTRMLVSTNGTEKDGEGSDGSGEESTKADHEEETPAPTWRSVGPRLASLFKKKNPNTNEAVHMEPAEPERAVVVADLNNNAFHCDVSIIRRRLSVIQDSENATAETEGGNIDEAEKSEKDELVATFPCAPALFGPTVIAKLVESNGALIERPIFPPDPDDEFGCGPDDEAEIPTITPVDEMEPMSDTDGPSEAGEAHDNVNVVEDDDTSCENKTIQLVQRGHCSFYLKAANQKKHANAEGVIVINNDDFELFIMSNGGDDEVGVNEEEMPVTVLLTGLDGEALLGVIQAESLAPIDETYMLAQISVYKQDPVVDETGSLKQSTEEIDWPIVRGSGEALQILAEGGWGIHAMRKDGGNIKGITGSNDLQIFLLKHSD